MQEYACTLHKPQEAGLTFGSLGMVICSWGCWNTDERGSNIGCHGKPNKGFQGSNPWNPPWAMVLAIRSPCEPWKKACTESTCTAPDPIWQC